MNGMSKYGAVATKIRGMRSRLFTIEDYERLASFRSVKEMAIYLKSHPVYAEVLEELNPEEMRREDFERMILRSVFVDFKKIMHFLDRDYKKLMAVFFTQYELRFLNNKIREIYNRHIEERNLEVYRAMYGTSPHFDFDKVIKANTMEELDQALEDSRFQEPVHTTMTTMDHPQLFDYETAVNRYYFSYLWETINDIGFKVDKETLLDVYGSEIDLLNIVWIYRAKTYYDLDAKSIHRFLIPACHILKQRDIARMIAANNTAELMGIISATRYGKYIDPQVPGSLEQAYVSHMAKLNAKVRKDHPYSFAVINAYAYDKKAEVDRIVRIAESVRYGYDPKLIISGLNIRGNS